jgi:O-antigen/teichoic acid export membrane protein
LDAFIKILRWMEIDRAVAFAILAKVWSLFAGPITLYLISIYLSPEMQGFYYTFLSLIALQSFVELGFYIVITQFASHEWANLQLDNERRIKGDSFAMSRLISLGRLVFKWYACASAIFVLLVGTGGYIFLAQSPDPGVSWAQPWFVLVLLSGLQLWALPFISLLEGCNQVKVVNCFRLFQGMASSCALWLTMSLGMGLWMVIVSSAMGLGVSSILLLVYYRKFFEPFYRATESSEIHWREEIWPMQWRLAVAGLMNYFIFSLYAPVIFHYHGSAAAGRIGMTWHLLMALSSLAMAWIATKVPRFGILISQKKYDELDRLFFKTSSVSLCVIGAGALVLWALIYGLNQAGHPMAERLLEPLPAGLFCLGVVLGQVSQCQAAYLRAHKKEPFLILNIVYSLANGLLVWGLGMQWGALGASMGYLTAMALICIPMGTVIWYRCRLKWHLPN